VTVGSEPWAGGLGSVAELVPPPAPPASGLLLQNPKEIGSG
jgi:hypothetical protein